MYRSTVSSPCSAVTVMNSSEAFFAKDRHMPATLKPGENFSAAMFVNDPNRRAPPPMLRPNTKDPTAALEWTPPDVAGNVSSTIAAGERFGIHRHARDLMGESGGTSDRLVSMGVYQEVVASTEPHSPPPTNAAPAAAPAAAPSNPFGSTSRHQLPPPQQQQAAGAETQWFMAPPTAVIATAPSSNAPPVANNSSVTHAALQAAVAASNRSIDALVRARNVLDQQIDEERQKHLQLVKLAEQAQMQAQAHR
eukprot:COSAG03_NODE_3177_length_2161_cov_1.516974_3_plen_251_part_00